jgi:hypothetical protein
MESPLGYALDALALTRGNPAVRALPFGNRMYTRIWREEGAVPDAFPATVAAYNAIQYPQSIKNAVKRLLLAFRDHTGNAFLAFDLNDDFDEFIDSCRFVTERPHHSNWVEIDAPAHVMVEADVAQVIAETRPDLTIHSFTPSGEARLTLTEGYWSPIQMRFASDAGFDGVRGHTIGTVRSVESVVGVGPRGGLVDRSTGSQQNVFTLDLPSVATITAALEQARGRYRDRVLSRLRRGYDATADFERKRAEHQAKTAANFTSFRARMQPQEERVIPTLPFVPNGVRASRRWGIEIETGAGRDVKQTPQGWDVKGDGSLDSAYGGYYTIDPSRCPENGEFHNLDEDDEDYSDPDYCDYCGEVYGGGYQSGDCREYVSPILTSMHSRGLKSLCDDLEFAPRTETAGIHVHVEAKDLTVGQVRELVLSYDHLEPLIESSYDRVERGYCKRRSTRELLEIARFGRENPDRPATETRTGDRYVTENLKALDYHGTVEIRPQRHI